jgi:hypothetical protein
MKKIYLAYALLSFTFVHKTIMVLALQLNKKISQNNWGELLEINEKGPLDDILNSI